jgi:hypothetical protein
VLQTTGFEGEFRGERCELSRFVCVEIKAFSSFVLTLQPKKDAVACAIIKSQQWGATGAGFNTVAGASRIGG